MLNQVMKVELISSTSMTINENTFSKIVVSQPVVDSSQERTKGFVLMEVACDPDVYESLPDTGYPHHIDMHVRLKAAAKGKMGFHCFKVDIVKALPKSQPAPPPKV